MLDHLLEENELRLEFRRYGLNERDIVFIKEMIAGPLQEHREEERKVEIDEERKVEIDEEEEEMDEEEVVEVCESPLGYSASVSCPSYVTVM